MTKKQDIFSSSTPYSERSLAIACTRGRQTIVAYFQELLNGAKISEQQWRVMRVLLDFEPIPLRELCNYCCIHKVSMTRIIRTLAERGFITRRQNTEDLRAYDIGLTQSGREFLEELTPIANGISQNIVDRFGRKKSIQLMKLLNELAEMPPE